MPFKLEKVNEYTYSYTEDGYIYQIEAHWPSMFLENHPVKHNAYVMKKIIDIDNNLATNTDYANTAYVNTIQNKKLLSMLNNEGVKTKDCTYDRAEQWLISKYNEIKN